MEGALPLRLKRLSAVLCDTRIIQQGINHNIVTEVIGEQICFLVAVLIIYGSRGAPGDSVARWN